jgi:uncharacterized protein
MLEKSDYNRSLELIILPTEKCNFRCTYCYEDFLIGKMKPWIRNGLKSLIKRRVDMGLRHLQLSWFGGEPLLAKDVLFEIAEFAATQLGDGRLESLRGSLTTNGYMLTADYLERLVASNHTHFQISLDGFEEGHDATRKYASGEGTFGVIWANLLAARDSHHHFEILIRIHLTDGNSDSVARLVAAIVKEFPGDDRFSVMLRRIENMGGENGEKIVVLDFDRAAKAARRLKSQLAGVGIRCHDAVSAGGFESQVSAIGAGSAATSPNAADTETLAGGYVCYAAQPNSLLIRADGRLGKCTVAFDDPRNTVGVIREDGTVFIDSKNMNFWLRGNVSGDAVELGCPAHA